MRRLSSPVPSRLPGAFSGLWAWGRHPWAPVLLVLSIPLLLGWTWKDAASGMTINPSYVNKIQDGKTTKQEVLVYFGDPKEIERTSDGLVYKYYTYKNADSLPYDPYKREPNEQSTSDYLLEDNQIKKKPEVKNGGKILKSSLEIRFKPDSNTVMSHEYKEF
ncbi:MAG: hypothetical protein WCF59_01000 [Desulfobaccales bacterium]|jgi:hypothetical protein